MSTAEIPTSLAPERGWLSTGGRDKGTAGVVELLFLSHPLELIELVKPELLA